MLETLADPDNWIGDPTTDEAEFTGDHTPFELAVEALADWDEGDEGGDTEEA